MQDEGWKRDQRCAAEVLYESIFQVGANMPDIDVLRGARDRRLIRAPPKGLRFKGPGH